MKNIFKNIKIKNLIIGGLVVAMGLCNSCTDQNAKDFYSPDTVSGDNALQFDQLFTGMLQTPDLFRLDYAPGYHNYRFTRNLGTTGFPDPDKNKMASGTYMYWNSDWGAASFRNNLWNFVYVNASKNMVMMNMVLKNYSAEDQQNYKVYTLCYDVCKMYMFQRLTDQYDDVPYTEAGGAWDKNYRPKFDTQKFIYTDILAQLKTLSDTLATYTLNDSKIQMKFKLADIVNGGDTQKWARFANSLRLRMAMRISIVDPAQSEVIIKECLASPAGFVDDHTQASELSASQGYANLWANSWYRAIYDKYDQLIAMKPMLNGLMAYKENATPAEAALIDPRVYVLFQPSVDGRYVGLEEWGPNQEPAIDADFSTLSANRIADIKKDNFNDDVDPAFACWNKMTVYSDKLMQPSIMPEEVHLLKAEAAVRYAATGLNAADEYQIALSESIDWLYNLNNNNSASISSQRQVIMPGSQYPKPAQPLIDAWVAQKTATFAAMSNSDKIKEIFNQKMIILNIWNPLEVWAEARRLEKDYGMLLPKPDMVVFPERTAYPTSEEQNNADNIAPLADKDNWTTPVWWTGR